MVKNKESACKVGDLGSIPGLGRPLEKAMDTHSVFWPEEFHGQRSLVGYSPWGHKESDMTERLSKHTNQSWIFSESCSVGSDSLIPHGLQPVRLLCPWDFPVKNTGVGYHFLLQGIILTQR